MENRTTSVGRQKCGFILNNCSKNDEGFYTFLATDVDKHDYKRTFEVKFQGLFSFIHNFTIILFKL